MTPYIYHYNWDSEVKGFHWHACCDRAGVWKSRPYPTVVCSRCMTRNGSYDTLLKPWDGQIVKLTK